MKECREPLKCLECGQLGHRRVSCPHWTSTQPKIVPNRHTATGLFACLVGEVRGSSPTWEHILSGLQDILVVPGIPECHRLASGDMFIRNLSQSTWLSLRGRMHRLPDGGSICWRRPRPTDGAFSCPSEGRRLELRGVPFGLRTWRSLEASLRPIGALQQIACNGIQARDPNIMCVDIQIRASTRIPGHLQLASADAAPILIAELPLPRPTSGSCPHIASSSSQPEATGPETEQPPPPLGMDVTGSIDTTSYAAMCAPGSDLAYDQQPDLDPAPGMFVPVVSLDTPEADFVTPTVPASLLITEESFTSDTPLVSIPASPSAWVVETSSGPSPIADTTMTTRIESAHPARPPAKHKSFGIFMGRMGRHCPRRGCSVPALKRPWSGKEAATVKAIRLAANLSAEASIAPPPVIASNMGAAQEATSRVDMVSK